MNKTNEQAFEALIEKALVGTTLEERQQTGVMILMHSLQT